MGVFFILVFAHFQGGIYTNSTKQIFILVVQTASLQ